MIKLIIENINGYNYTLKDNENNYYNINQYKKNHHIS